MNVVILMGRIAKDPYVNGDGNVTKLKLATKTGYDREKQQERTAFVPVTIFGLSEAQIGKLEKGRKIAVQGIVNERSFEKDGETVYVTDVTVNKAGLTLL